MREPAEGGWSRLSVLSAKLRSYSYRRSVGVRHLPECRPAEGRGVIDAACVTKTDSLRERKYYDAGKALHHHNVAGETHKRLDYVG